MTRETQQPLTTAALQKFLETVETQVKATKLHPGTKADILLEVAAKVLPVDHENETEPSPRIVIATYTELPKTLSQLRERVNDLIPNFIAHDERSDALAKRAMETIFENACNVAAQEMRQKNPRVR